MITRRRFIVAAAATAVVAAAPAAFAHHGWRWTASGNFELTGTIRTVRLGNPHGILTVDVDGETWTVEVGQPWRNARAGLADDMLREGVEITVSGERSADAQERLVKAERVMIGGRLFNLYPNRD